MIVGYSHIYRTEVIRMAFSVDSFEVYIEKHWHLLVTVNYCFHTRTNNMT